MLCNERHEISCANGKDSYPAYFISQFISCKKYPPRDTSPLCGERPRREVANLRAQVQLHALWGNCTAAIARQQYCLWSRLTNNIPNMSARAFSLPIRAFSRPQVAQQAERYTCRRCLHTTQTQAQEAAPVQIDAQAPILPVPVSQPKTAAKYNPTLNASQRDYRLSKTDRRVKTILPHTIRPQLLQHVDPALLHGRERDAALKAEKHKEIVGVVVRTGKMDKTVSVRVAGRRYEPRIGKV